MTIHQPMKTAITSAGNNPDDNIDRHFGRCACFVIYDDSTGGIEILPNPNQANMENSGPASVELLAKKGVSKVVSGEFGVKVKELFDIMKIQMIIVRETKKVSEIIALLKQPR